MRYTKNYAQAQKREERGIFNCYYQAIRVAHMDGHRKTLQLVRENMIEGDNDLTIDVWNNFLNVCKELRVDTRPITDVVRIHPSDPGKGNGYRIPRKEVDMVGHVKMIERRREWRKRFRCHFEAAEILQELSRPKLRLVE